MTLMVVTSQTRAHTRNSIYAERNHARGKAYVARLLPGPRGSVSREFLRKSKPTAGSVSYAVRGQPGDIYEIRRWRWDAARESFVGGVVYIGFDEAARPFMLSREEAMASAAMADRLLQAGRVYPDQPLAKPAGRLLPMDIQFIP